MKKLYRSRTDKIIAGVCGGLSAYFEIDPVIVRIVFVLLAFAHGLGILGYLILMLAVPRELGEEVETKRREKIEEFAHKTGEKVKTLAHEFSREAGSLKREFEGETSRRSMSGKMIIGIVLVIVGGVAFLNEFFPMPWLEWRFLWPVGIILIGFYIVTKNRRKQS